MNPKIYYSPMTSSAQNQSANGQGAQRASGDTRVPMGHPSTSTQAHQSEKKPSRRRYQRSKADPDLIMKSWNLDDAQGLPSPVVLKQDSTTSTSSDIDPIGTPPDHHMDPCTNGTKNIMPKMPATEVGVSRSERQGTNGLSLDRNTSAAPSSDSTSTNSDSANPMQHHRLSVSHPTQTTIPPIDPLSLHNTHAVLHDASLVNVEGPPQNAAPSYPYPLAIRTCTGIHFIPESTDREEIAAFVEKAHFILTPEMERMLAALDLEPFLPADHVDTQPQQAIDVKRGAPSTTSSRGKGAFKRARNETVEMSDERQGPTKKMRSNAPRRGEGSRGRDRHGGTPTRTRTPQR